MREKPVIDQDGDLRRSSAWRIVQILDVVAHSPDPVGIRETARTTSIDKSAISRVLSQLAELGWVEKEPVSGRYTVGSSLFAFASALVARDSLVNAATPLLGGVTEQYNETVYLAVREPTHFTYRMRIDCNRTIRHIIDVGYQGPYHAGAAGHAILSGMTPDELEATLAAIELIPITDQTITAEDALRAAIEKCRIDGFSFTQGERLEGGTAVAAPFFDAQRRCVGSVVLSRPRERHSEDDLQSIAESIMTAADALTVRIGGDEKYRVSALSEGLSQDSDSQSSMEEESDADGVEEDEYGTHTDG